MNKSHPLSDIYFYLRVVELGSIRSAAKEAGMEPSSLSRKITSLEHRLKCKLLDRTQGQTSVTHAGEVYYQKMRKLLPQLEEIESEISGEVGVPKGLLKVNAAIDFGQKYVTQWLLDFRKKFPLVEVQLTLASGYIDIVTEGIDVAIRVGKLKDSSLRASKIATVPRVLVASKAYIETFGIPKEANDLSQHQHIFFTPATRNTPIVIQTPNNETISVPRNGKVSINAVAAVVKAVLAGEGIHLGPRWAFQDHIDSGDIIELLPDHIFPSMDMHAVWSSAEIMPARTRCFIDFVKQQAAEVAGLGKA